MLCEPYVGVMAHRFYRRRRFEKLSYCAQLAPSRLLGHVPERDWLKRKRLKPPGPFIRDRDFSVRPAQEDARSHMLLPPWQSRNETVFYEDHRAPSPGQPLVVYIDIAFLIAA